ncbi:hypothetical protein BJY04DRAFT_207663 [Aspergillus karnatakaensis]|uniref:uncharacterized protein n=1 Tax=Aspergillus karnatakaensis TaxID=1810916 RepID=UPI003CCDF95F
MSSERPVLVVLGATGNQGGSVVSYFLSKWPSIYAIRAITRDPSSAKSVALAAQGAEVVAGNYDDPLSLNAAFRGASAIFSVTDYMPPFLDPSQREKAAVSGQNIGELCRDIEAQKTRNIFDAAAKVSTLERLVLSTLPNASKISGGKYAHVYQYDGKAIGAEYGRCTYPDLWAKTSVFYAGFYLENWLGAPGAILRPKLDTSKGKLVSNISEPIASAPMPIYSALNDTGNLVHALLRAAPGVSLLGINELLSFRDVATLIAEAQKQEIEYVESGPNFDLGDPDFNKQNEQMLGFILEFGYDGSSIDKSVIQPNALDLPVELETVGKWIAKQDWESVLEVV